MDETTPDQVEEQDAEQIDDLIPTRGYQMLPVVGIGGSAGGVEAICAFLQGMPARSGLAFVVVMHLSPEHESMLAEVLQRCTPMRVVQVQESVRIEADTLYVIPPRKALNTFDGWLHLSDLPQARRRHVAVDIFFRTLADTHGPHAAAIVLSGGDGDGAIGIKRVKERGGLTIAQDPEEAQVSGMPRAALATGMVDWTLPVAQMAERVLQYYRMEVRLRLPSEHGPVSAAPSPHAAADGDETALKEVLALLRSRTGRDFSNYKRATIVRRIGRRMQVNNVPDLPAYLDCLRTRSGEAGALLQDLLISVTNFFRDTECFAALEAQIPRLFEGKSGADTVRVWVAGCATGEEAYSIAMLFNEHARTLDAPPALQVFATDLDDNAIRIAREAIYPTTIQADVNEDRLRRFFVKEHRGFRVRRELRESVMFAVHDVLRDSPFSRIDLVSCRNLLIYLNREAQTRVLETFHFSLLPGGTLFLGSSESIEEGGQHYAVIDKKHRLFGQRHIPRAGLPVPMQSNMLARALEAQMAARSGPVVPNAAVMRPAADEPARLLEVGGRTLGWSELHLKLIQQLAPPSILVDAEHDILHMSASAGRFMQISGGEPTRNVLRLIHPALRIELRAALYQASNTGETARTAMPSLELGGETVRVQIEVRSMVEAAPGLLLVLVDAAPASAEARAESAGAGWVQTGADLVTDQLDREMERLKSHLRDTVEQYEASTEELKASNEELQSMNEELRSATEELETSREELQSINEELTTVNHELKSKVDELGNANSDMQNLMDATAIPTVFLDRELRITRYTPSAITLFNLISSDIGRPLAHLHTQLDYTDLVEDAQSVLASLAPVERQVGGAAAQSYLARLRPYRTLDDRIAGVVLTFVDISERVHGAEALRQSEERFSAIVNHAAVGVVQAELDGRITFVNQHYARLLGYGADELAGRSLLDLVHPEDLAQCREKMQRLAAHREQFQLEKRCLRKDGSIVWLHDSVSYVADAAGRPTAAIVVCTDISERKRAEAALRESTEWLRLILENAVEYAIFSIDMERRITTWNSGAERLLGYAEREILGQKVDLIFTPEDRAADAPRREVEGALREGRIIDDRLHQRKDGNQFWASGAMMAMHDANGKTVGVVKILRDQSEQRASQQALEQSRVELLEALAGNERVRAELQMADEAKDRFLAVLSHELRNPLASISNAADVLASGHTAPREHERAVRIVERQSQVMKVLLDDLLDVSRLRLGRLVLHPQEVELAAVVDSALESVRPLVEAADHALAVRLPDAPVRLQADPVRLAQVISNLLNNAVKYTPRGGHIALTARLEAADVSILVEDDGIGMDPVQVESMFEMFSQSPEAIGRGGQGLGIGLALVRNIVELHGGRVHGESRGPGQGSRFTVVLPLVQPGGVPPPGAPPRPGTQKRVLVVDDNADVAWSVSRLLHGCEVATAGSGAEALELLRARPFDVVVLDLGMPGMGGIEVARAIRAAPWGAGILLIAATGWGQEKDRKLARDAGFDAHFVKPLDVAQLLRRIHAAPGP
ncbi:MAG: PAS domain S-box protein [Xylophilus ampelinus]